MDSDDFYLYLGYQGKNWTIIPAFNYERHGVVYHFPPEVKIELRLSVIYQTNGWLFDLYLENEYFENIGFQCSILELYGSIELAPVLGLSDFVVDIVETGKTLKENGLKEHDTIAKVSSLLIANKVSYKLKRKEIDSIIDRIKL